MQFLSPIYLLGILAVAAPILIHLIRRRKVTVVPWAAHRFLVAVTRRLQKRKRIDDLILLLLRCLLCLLLALLFARPFLAGSNDVVIDEEGTLVLLVDASASMAYTDGVRSRFDGARDQVEAALDGLPESTAVALILFADQAYPIVAPPTMEHNVVLQEMERQQVRPGRSNLPAGLSVALEVLANRGGGSVLLISDGQAAAWNDTAELRRLAQQAREQSVSVRVLNSAAGRSATNIGITALDAENVRPIAGQDVPLQLVVKNGGLEAFEETRVVLEKEIGVPVQEAWVPPLEPGDAATVALETTFSDTGWQCLTARISGDNLAMDNTRTIGLSVTSGLRLGIVEGSRTGAAKVDPAFFFSAAAVPVPQPEVRRFHVQASALEQRAINRETLREFNVIALVGVSAMTRPQADALAAFMEDGGGVWIIPPSDTALVRQFAEDRFLRELMPAQGVALAEDRSGMPAAPPYDHPITGFWNAGTAGSLGSFFADRYLRIEASDTAEAVLRFRNEDLLFVAGQRGAGRVLLSALSFDGSWSQLPLSPQFVPLVQRSLSWLSGSVDAPSSLAPGEGWRAVVPAIHVGRPFYAKTPLTEGEPKLAGQVEFYEGRAFIFYSDTRSLGRYTLYLDPEGEPVGSFGVNLAPAESDLRQVSEDELAGLFEDSIEQIDGAERSRGIFSRFASALPDLWVVLLLLILVTGAVELYLAQRFSRSS